MTKLLWRLLVTVHLGIFMCNTCAIVMLPLTQPVWVWLPLSTFLVRASFGHTCPLTMAENALRRRLGMPAIVGFVEHYLWKRFAKRL